MSRKGTLPFAVSKRQAVKPERKSKMRVAESAESVIATFSPQVYSKWYFDVSPTWQHWNKLTAADVHTLSTDPGYQGQKVYFYRNHPIQFVRVVGLVVEIETLAEGKYTLLTLDDGSGECMVVKIKRRELAKDDEAEYPSNTEVDNVDVRVSMGLPSVFLDNKPVQLGDVVKVKGTIETFRNVRQLELKRMFKVKDTNEEAQTWSEVARWKRDVLSKPWVLSTAERDKVDAQIQREKQKEREKTRRKREWDARLLEKRRRHDEEHEARRKEEELRYNAGALKGSNVILAPWE